MLVPILKEDGKKKSKSTNPIIIVLKNINNLPNYLPTPLGIFELFGNINLYSSCWLSFNQSRSLSKIPTSMIFLSFFHSRNPSDYFSSLFKS